MRTRLRAVAAALAASAAIATPLACGSSSTPSVPAPTTAPARSTLGSIAALQQRLTGAGITCQLEYESLRDDQKELSLCVIDGERATLTVWNDPSLLEAFLASPDRTATGATAVGQDWTVDTTTPAVAQKVADALGGTVRS